jgi:hypothetical protein
MHRAPAIGTTTRLVAATLPPLPDTGDGSVLPTQSAANPGLTIMALAAPYAGRGGFVGAYVVGWLQDGVSNAAAYTFMAARLLLSALLMLAVTVRGRRGATDADDLATIPAGG